MNRVVIHLIALTILLLGGASSQSQAPTASEKKLVFYCPVAGMPDRPLVLGEPYSKECCCPRTPWSYHYKAFCDYQPQARLTVEYKGCTLQVCCKQCIKIFNDSPAKFAAVAHHQLVATKQAEQVQCPLTGKTFDRAIFTDVAGIRVFFASKESQKKVADASATERVKLVFSEQAFAHGFRVTANRLFCPIVGPDRCSYFPPLGELPEFTVEHRGAKVQVCCEICQQMFKKSPAEFAVNAHHQIVATKQAKQVRCPLTGEAINRAIFTDVAGVRVYFASHESQKKVADANIGAQLNLVFGEQAFSRGFEMTKLKK